MTTASTSGSEPARVDQQGVAQHRDYLYRYALLQLRDASRTEDVVQETLLAALESGDRFSGKSSLRTWLTGILEHKIIDVFRKQSREAPRPRIDPGPS
jgi:RNA polymerase sigma-70 factor (ECF subfamily)